VRLEALAPEPALDTLPFFALLPPALRAMVRDRFVPVVYPFGSVIVAEGDPADGLYLLTAGRARVLMKDADLIIVLEQGRLVERGTHDELMRRRGLCFYLVSQQLEL
jgi:CRP-like cAMP-binding protein